MAQVRKFKYGVLQGKPLDSRGDYNIVMFNGERVAQFSNGSMAHFTVEENDDVPISNEPLSDAEIKRGREIAESLAPIEVVKGEPSTFMPEKSKTRKNSVRWTSQGDTFDFWPALAITFWADGFSVDLTWFNFGVAWEYRTELKRRNE